MKCFCPAGIAFLKTLGYNLTERVKNSPLIRKEIFKMKVTHITDIDKFFEVIDSCKGRVELVTGEGDRLNLKSKLSQYVSLANIFSAGEIQSLRSLQQRKRISTSL